ncbi:yfeABCD locus regulator [Photobacterium damselae subsp. damselae]|uniref:YniB family protein n=1 Tax=Photobacterium damselae TaxID=38293 RepID=UPI000D082154|nr:YniB family protein [Photobacterium damselae]PSB86699.1 yfeABCD locus regulator [Photobacterium damselae subsp. damselae]PSB88657.1 yfeABCD locus regulator [Photobacterium damselae subsp. damselae]
MNHYKETKKKSYLYRLLGFLLGTISLISITISALKFMYSVYDTNTQFGAALTAKIQPIIYSIYENTQFLSFFWNYSPVPNHLHILTDNNFYFLLTIITFFISIYLKSKGKELAIRLKKIDIEIENEAIKNSRIR